jgi:hypothetical protein
MQTRGERGPHSSELTIPEEQLRHDPFDKRMRTIKEPPLELKVPTSSKSDSPSSERTDHDSTLSKHAYQDGPSPAPRHGSEAEQPLRSFPEQSEMLGSQNPTLPWDGVGWPSMEQGPLYPVVAVLDLPQQPDNESCPDSLNSEWNLSWM